MHLKKKNKIIIVLVSLLFVIKMLIFYFTVKINVFRHISFIFTLAIFGLLVHIFLHSDGAFKRRKFLIIYGIFSVLLFIDVIYYSYFNQLVSINQLWQLKNISGSEESVKAAIPLVSFLLLLDIPILWMLLRRYEPDEKRRRIGKKEKRIYLAGIFICILLIAVNPFKMSSLTKIGNIEVITSHIKDILDNTIGRLTYQNSTLPEVLDEAQIPESVVEEVMEQVEDDGVRGSGSRYKDVAEGKNLIMIQLESFQNFAIGTWYNGQELTPNLNKLITRDTIYVPNLYTNMGKGNTADAEFSAITGLYPVVEGSSYDLYTDNKYIGLPWLLREKGYSTSVSLGMNGEFYNRDVAYTYQGYEDFFTDANAFVMDEVSGFGLTDKSMFLQLVEILDHRQKPFFNFAITLTNHYPYVIPEEMSSLELREEDEGTLFGSYLQTMRYTDEALGDFIQALSEKDWFDHTMIVMYGDHHGLNYINEDNHDKMTELLGYDYDYDTMLNIPLIIHIPGLGESETVETVGGQVDLLPTLANLMDLDLSETVTFGQDILNAREGFVATIVYMVEGSFIKDGVLYEIGRDGTFEGGRAIDLKTHEPMSIEGLELYSEKAQALLETSKYILEHNMAVGKVDTTSLMESDDDE